MRRPWPDRRGATNLAFVIGAAKWDAAQAAYRLLLFGTAAEAREHGAAISVYTADLLYTSNRGGTISLDVNGKDAGKLTIPTTFNAADPIAWRQWHHWNFARDLVELIPVGKSVLTVHILTQGNMNLAYFDFKKSR